MEARAQDMPDTLGADLRALRKRRGLTLTEMADTLGRSVGWLSQVERGLSDPTAQDLKHIAAEMDVSYDMLFRREATPEHEAAHIVRASARRPIGSHVEGLVEELLSPDLTDDFEVVHSTFQPHSRIRVPVTRPTQEVGYVLSGQLDIEIENVTHTINPGDSFRIRGEPFRWANPYQTPAVAIWIIAPPVY